MSDELQVPLATAIESLREQLEQAMDSGKDRELRFVLGSIDLELELELVRTGGAGGGLNVWMVSFRGERERSSAVTHTVRLSLTPVSKGGSKTLVADTSLAERPR